MTASEDLASSTFIHHLTLHLEIVISTVSLSNISLFYQNYSLCKLTGIIRNIEDVSGPI